MFRQQPAIIRELLRSFWVTWNTNRMGGISYNVWLRGLLHIAYCILFVISDTMCYFNATLFMIFWVIRHLHVLCVVFVTFVLLANTHIVLVLLTATSVFAAVDSLVGIHFSHWALCLIFRIQSLLKSWEWKTLHHTLRVSCIISTCKHYYILCYETSTYMYITV
jgi:hypothetical protein